MSLIEMEVILRADVLKLGRPGEKKRVAPGYARNYLIPNGLVWEATPGNLRLWEKEKEKRQKEAEQRLQNARERGGRLAQVVLHFSRPVGEENKLFGSVSRMDLWKSLKSAGFEVEKNQILLEAPLRTVGDHRVSVLLHPEVTISIGVTIVPRAS
ncbi:MAG: 50S ribosomal protein L9 [Elusimicrobia bacterium]|nr:50S ribosomal protein L9 [Elusimicrobiota bacterium]